MNLQDRLYSDEFLKKIHLELYKLDGVNIIYKDNVGNLYNFIQMEGGFKFVSEDKNKVKIMKGFYER